MLVSPGYLGRFTVAEAVNFKFTTFATTGAPTTLTGSPAISVYENGNTTEFTTGVTLTADYDGKTGLNDVVIDTSSGYTAGKQYTVFISAGTVGGVSHVGYVVGHFYLQPEPADLRAVNGGSTGATAGKLELDQLVVAPASGDKHAVQLTPSGTGKAINALGQVAIAPTSGEGLFISSANRTAVILLGGTDSPGIEIDGGSNGDGILLVPQGTGKAINALGQIFVEATGTNEAAMLLSADHGSGLQLSGGDSRPALLITSLGDQQGIYVEADGTGAVVELAPFGTGKGIECPVESGVDLISSLKLCNAANAGKANGMAGTTVHLRNPADTLNRITATVDADGNRTSVTTDLT